MPAAPLATLDHPAPSPVVRYRHEQLAWAQDGGAGRRHSRVAGSAAARGRADRRLVEGAAQRGLLTQAGGAACCVMPDEPLHLNCSCKKNAREYAAQF